MIGRETMKIQSRKSKRRIHFKLRYSQLRKFHQEEMNIEELTMKMIESSPIMTEQHYLMATKFHLIKNMREQVLL
jgi:hypothetical protein